MKRILLLSLFVAIFIAVGSVTNTRKTKAHPVTTCTATGFFRDGINMTAALINPPTVSGTVDATGCNIGVYYDGGSAGVIKDAEIFGANYFGILANGDSDDVTLDVLSSSIHDIGETPLNGTQHGVAIYWRGFFAGGGVTGRIVGNTISNYQKGAIVTNGTGVQAMIADNVVTGEGHITYIAQNGIQVGYGASASVMRNRVSGNSFIGFPGDGSSSGAILVVGGPGYGACPDSNPCPYTVNTKVTDNIVANNDVGVYLSNLGAAPDYAAPSSATNIKAVNNTISSDSLCFNTSYQAGISDIGNNDKLITNKISGYAGCSTYSVSIDADVSFTNRPKVHANK